MQVSKWGNSLAVRLPAKLVEEHALKEGDEIEITVVDGTRLEITKVEERRKALQKLRELGPLLPADYKFDRADAYPVRRGGSDPHE